MRGNGSTSRGRGEDRGERTQQPSKQRGILTRGRSDSHQRLSRFKQAISARSEADELNERWSPSPASRLPLSPSVETSERLEQPLGRHRTPPEHRPRSPSPSLTRPRSPPRHFPSSPSSAQRLSRAPVEPFSSTVTPPEVSPCPPDTPRRRRRRRNISRS